MEETLDIKTDVKSECGRESEHWGSCEVQMWTRLGTLGLRCSQIVEEAINVRAQVKSKC